MTVNDITAVLHQLFYDTFEILPVLENNANNFFIVVLAIFAVYWIGVLLKNPEKEA